MAKSRQTVDARKQWVPPLYKKRGIFYTYGYDEEQKWAKSTEETRRDEAILVARAIHETKLAQAKERKETFRLDVCLDEYLRSLEGTIKARSIAIHQRKANNLCETLGDGFNANQLNLTTLENYFQERRREGASAYYIEQELSFLYSAIRYAQRKDRLKHINVDAIRPRGSTGNYAPEVRYLSDEEIKKAIGACTGTLAKYRDYLITYIHLGIRRDEIHRILPEHVKEESVFIDGTKTRKARRHIPTSPMVRAILARRKKITEQGSPLFRSQVDISKVCGRIAKKAGIARFSHNDLRRTFCCLLLNRNISNRTIADLLGHTTTDMVDRVYGTIAQETKARAIATLPSFEIEEAPADLSLN